MKNKAIYVVIIILLAAGLLGIIGILIYQAFEGTPLPTTEPVKITATLEMPVMATVTITQVFFTPTAPPTRVPTTIMSICGETGSTNILLVARDENMWKFPYGAEVIRLINIDFDQKTSIVYAFPRDLLLPTKVLNEKYGIDELRLGSVYSTILQREGGPDNNKAKAEILAVQATEQVLKDNFQVNSDHYIILKENSLKKAVDLVGGIEVNVPKDISTPGVSLKAGDQTLDGTTAQLYVRLLSSSADEWERFNRQNAVLAGLKKKLASSSVFLKLLEYYQQFKDYLITDLSVTQLVNLFCAANKIDFKQIDEQIIPFEMVSVQKDGALVIKDPAAMKELIQDTFKK